VDTGLGDTLPNSVHECSRLRREVKKDILAIVNHSFLRREQERQQKIESLMQSGRQRDQDHATRLRNLHKAEAINQLFEKSLRLGRQKSGVTCIEIPSPPHADPKTCTSSVQIDIPDDVAFHLRERNQRHFG